MLMFLWTGSTLAQPVWMPTPYEPGQGLNFPGLGLNLGGYFSLNYNNYQGQDAAVRLQDLSFFVHKDVGRRWTLFTELELGELVQLTRDGADTGDAEFDIERLYADYRAGPRITLRVGKFLTPVGRWNLIHADPLVWTVSRPLTSAVPFARHASGAMLYGTLPLAHADLDYSLFADNTERLDPRELRELAYEDNGSTLETHNAFSHALGGRLVYSMIDDRLQLGLSWVSFRTQETREGKRLVGLDLYWKVRGMELTGEALRRYSSGDTEPDVYGGFLQAAVPLVHDWHLIGRYERYQAAEVDTSTHLRTLGLTWRPHPAVSWKLEYRDGTGNDEVAPSGLLGSLAVLF